MNPPCSTRKTTQAFRIRLVTGSVWRPDGVQARRVLKGKVDDSAFAPDAVTGKRRVTYDRPRSPCDHLRLAHEQVARDMVAHFSSLKAKG